MMRRKRWLRLRPPSRKKKELKTYAFSKERQSHSPSPTIHLTSSPADTATHHFSDVRKAVSEVARVLKQDGRFLLVDHYAPEDPILDEFINHLNRLRDPSHVRESSLSEWQAMFSANQLAYQDIQKWNLPIQYDSWIKRGGTPADREKQIIAHLNHASDEARDTFCITLNQNGQSISFCLKAILIQGIKR